MHRFILATTACLLLAQPPAEAQPPQLASGHPCAVITCDCDNVSAGLLTRQWQRDCRTCQQRRIEACTQSYPPLHAAIAAGGYCRTHCGAAIGPNPYPEPPPRAEGGTPGGGVASSPIAAPLHGCAPNQRRESVTIDGLAFTGSLDGQGRRHGLWLARDEAQGRIVEIVFVDGKERSRQSHRSR